MKIYDCFSYWDEDLLLDLRLNILDDYVDYFVIVEGNKTWQNNYKKFRFDLEKFNKFKKKIIYIQVDNMPDGKNPWVRENFQRNCIERGLKNAKKDDLIIISDLDEIPNPQIIKNFDSQKRYVALKQNHYYYKLNLQAQNNPYWLGSRMCVRKYLKSPQWLRSLKFKKRPFWRIDKFRLNNIIDNGGWHFCNLKTASDLLYKYKNLCETDDQYVFNEKISDEFLDKNKIKEKIDQGLDLLGRKEKFNVVKIDDNFPKYLLDNISKYSEWISK